MIDTNSNQTNGTFVSEWRTSLFGIATTFVYFSFYKKKILVLPVFFSAFCVYLFKLTFFIIFEEAEVWKANRYSYRQTDKNVK